MRLVTIDFVVLIMLFMVIFRGSSDFFFLVCRLTSYFFFCHTFIIFDDIQIKLNTNRQNCLMEHAQLSEISDFDVQMKLAHTKNFILPIASLTHHMQFFLWWQLYSSATYHPMY